MKYAKMGLYLWKYVIIIEVEGNNFSIFKLLKDLRKCIRIIKNYSIQYKTLSTSHHNL